MLLLRAPAVYRPQSDTWLLSDALAAEVSSWPFPDPAILDICSGTGALALSAARLGLSDVTAVDISRRAVATAWLNARIRGLTVRVHRGDLLGPIGERRFDLIVANPPYVPAVSHRLPTGGMARCWDGGTDGRAVLDRICATAPPLLRPCGVLLVVFSSISGEQVTRTQLEARGLAVSVVARRLHPFGPVMRSRAPMLERRGLIAPGQHWEELVVMRGQAS